MATGLKSYYPEMSEQRPESTQIDAISCHGTDHYILKTPLTLSGRGIKHLGVLTASRLVPEAQHKVGWNEYKVTQAAFDRICDQYSVAMEAML